MKSLLVFLILIINAYGTEAEKLTASCKNGDPEACLGIGSLYWFGYGLNKDVRKASEFFTKACDIGNAEGCLNAATIYNTETDKAAEFYAKACDSGDVVSCIMAVRLYENDTWTGKDSAKAIEYRKKECKLVYRNECDLLMTYEDVWNAYGITSKYDKDKYLKYEVNASEALKLKKDKPYINADIAFTLLSLFDRKLAGEIYWSLPSKDQYHTYRVDRAYFEPVIKFAEDYNMPLPDAVRWYKHIEPEHSHTKQLIIDYYKNGFSVFVADDYIKYSTPVEKAKQSEKLAQKECGKDWDDTMKSGFINVTGNPYTLENRCLRVRKLESISILSKSSALYEYGNTWMKITDPTRAASTYFTGIIKFTKPVKFIKPDGLPTMIPAAKSIATHSWL